MTDIELQNRKYLDYASGGTRPDYQYLAAPNSPAKPMTFEEQHVYDLDKAIALEARLLQQDLREKEKFSATYFSDTMKLMQSIVDEALRYDNDISHLPCYPRYCAYRRYFKTGGVQ